MRLLDGKQVPHNTRIGGKLVRLKSRNVVYAAFGVALGIAVPPLYAQTGEEVIEARIKFMQEDIGSHWKILAAFVKGGGQGNLAEIEKSALAISGLAKKIPSHFPKDSGRGKHPDYLTRALPAIWTEPQKFQGYVQKLEEGSVKLAALAKAGDRAAVLEMIGASASYNKTNIGCADCHQSYQGPRVKK